jgi:hypothetical protein
LHRLLAAGGDVPTRGIYKYSMSTDSVFEPGRSLDRTWNDANFDALNFSGIENDSILKFLRTWRTILVVSTWGDSVIRIIPMTESVYRMRLFSL